MTWSDMSPKDVLDGLAAAGLLPQPRFTAPVVVDMSIDRLRSSYRGAIIGTAIGDALGRPAEGRNASLLRKRYGLLTDFQPWRGWTGGPKGTITDDTQMTICVAECLLANTGRLDPGDLALRFIDWLPAGRGRGHTCVEAVNRLLAGVPWHEAGIASAGNGAAMRAAPVGLAHLDDFNALRHDAALSAIVTHRDPMAVASAVAHAWLVARLAAMAPGTLDPAILVHDLSDAISDLHDPGAVERNWHHRRGKSGGTVRLSERLAEVPGLLSLSPKEASEYFYCGAFVLESLPMALWHFLRFPDDAEAAVIAAVMAGHDADTIASMTGAYAGAYLGEEAFPARWRGEDLEYGSELTDLADRLLAVARDAQSAGTAEVSVRDRIGGCILGGAVGDALGAEVEFLSIEEIRDRWGPAGITSYAGHGGVGHISDDTQMTLFTAEGLIRANNRSADRGLCNVPAVLYRAYLRWLLTQDRDPGSIPWDEFGSGEPSGWLISRRELWERRAPGATCLSALRSGGMGTPDHPINDSKGCGGVMRVAPVGLVANEPFRLGCEVAAITHTHPTGYLAAGAFAEILSGVILGQRIPEAVTAARERTLGEEGSRETVAAIDAAVELATMEPTASPETIESLGGGWVAEEALAIALYCALTARDFQGGVLAAVNHSGDSDSTGAICGNLLGAALGAGAIPAMWQHELAEAEVVTLVASDLASQFTDDRSRCEIDRYPMW